MVPMHADLQRRGPRSVAPSRQRTANKRSRGPSAVLAIGPLTFNFLVAGAGFEPATSGL